MFVFGYLLSLFTCLRFGRRLLCGKENVNEQAMHQERKQLNKRYSH